MKVFLTRAMVVCALMVLAVPVWSATYTIGDPAVSVGDLDKFLYSGTLGNSGAGTELQWVKDYFESQGWTQSQLDALTLYQNNNSFNFVNVNESSTVIASDLFGTPDYFFLKLGNVNGPDHILFENLDSKAYAVVDLASTEYSLVNIGKISHIGEVGGSTPVPEPGTMMLLGSGLIGLAGWGRKKFRK